MVEGALLAAIVADAVGQAGALPLVSHALPETWHRRRGNTLTLAGYQAAGGIDGALATTAEQLYTSLTASQQRTARDLFLRLTAIGDGTEPTRRRVARTELEPDIAPLLELLAGARLVTLDESTVTLAHEALIRAWPRLGRWDNRRRRPLAHVPGAVSVLAFSADSRWLATADDTRSSVDVWDVRTMTRVAELPGHREGVLDVEFSPDSTLLAVGGTDHTIALWDVRRATRYAELIGHNGPVDGLAFSSDGRLLATAGHDELVMVWDVVRRRATATLEGHQGWVRDVAFSPDNRTLASASIDRTVRVWDVPTRRHLTTLAGHADAAKGVTFSPDGRLLAFTSDDETVTLWDLARRTPVARLTGHTAAADAIAFSPDGGTLASAGLDHTAILFPVEPATAMTRVCSAMRRDLTTTEWEHHIPDVNPIAVCPGR